MIHIITEQAHLLRAAMLPTLSLETGFGPWEPDCPIAGHCAVAAYLGNRLFGWFMASTRENGQSHWFSLCAETGDKSIPWIHIDVTGDQFGHAPVRACIEPLYSEWRTRGLHELTEETLRRAILVEKRILVHAAAHAELPLSKQIEIKNSALEKLRERSTAPTA